MWSCIHTNSSPKAHCCPFNSTCHHQTLIIDASSQTFSRSQQQDGEHATTTGFKPRAEKPYLIDRHACIQVTSSIALHIRRGSTKLYNMDTQSQTNAHVNIVVLEPDYSRKHIFFKFFFSFNKSSIDA